jgi:hypothetical protein
MDLGRGLLLLNYSVIRVDEMRNIAKNFVKVASVQLQLQWSTFTIRIADVMNWYERGARGSVVG